MEIPIEPGSSSHKVIRVSSFNSDMEDQVLFDIEANPEDGFFSIYAGLKMLLDHESKWQIEKNKGLSKENQVFSIVGCEAYCRIQQLKESHPEMFISAERRYNT